MGWRRTGTFRTAEEILVLTCDVCECDIGNEDERRPQPHFRLSLHPNAGAMGDQEPVAILCSRNCLRAYAATLEGPERSPSAAGKPR